VRDRERRQREVVGEEAEAVLCLGIDVAHTTQRPRIVASGICGGQADRVIRLHTGRKIDRTRGPSSEPHPFLRAGHEERRFLGEAMQAFEIDVPAVHDVDGPGLEHQIIKERHVRGFSFGNLHDGGDRPAEIELRVQFHGGIVSSIAGPRKHRQTEVDDGRVEGVHRVRQVDGEGLIDIERPRGANQAVREVGVDAPVAGFVGIRDRRSRDARADAEVIELRLHGAQTRFDIP
jgi:hypothetical protein